MKLIRSLADGLLAAHPQDAARALESLPEEEALAVLVAAPARAASETLQYLAIHRAVRLLQAMERPRAARVLEGLGLDLASNLLRHLGQEQREALLGALPEDRARSLKKLLRFPEGCAGALMDPEVLALPLDQSAEEALAHIREAPGNVRYNLYVVDRDQKLAGVLNLRELLLARKKDLIGSIARRDVLALSARADRHTIREHPAWHDARSVPVVDENGMYLGAVRYQALRRLEEEERGQDGVGAGTTAEALGDLFSTGIAGMFGAVASTVVRPFPRDSEA